MCVSVLTTASGGNLQLSVREVRKTIRSLCNWEQEGKCEKSRSVRRITIGHIWVWVFKCVWGRSSSSHSLHTRDFCPPSVLSISQLLVLALKASGEFRWTMKTKSSADPLSLPSPFPPYQLPEKQDVMYSTSERRKGTCRLLKLTIFLNRNTLHKTTRAYRMHTLIKPPADGWLSPTISSCSCGENPPWPIFLS